MQRPRVMEILAAILLSSAAVARAQQPPPAPATQADADDLAKKLANPISDLVSVPFQFNWEQGVGPNEVTRFILNVQPVMPFSLNKDWNLITRVIVPFVGQPALVEGGSPASGISDVLASFFFSPRRPGLIGAWDRRSAFHQPVSPLSEQRSGVPAQPSSR